MSRSCKLRVTGCEFHHRGFARLRTAHNLRLATAFSLVELLIVVGIIVLIIAMTVPALNIITGKRSVDTAENQISVLLGRARTEAIGVQQYRGVMFYYDPADGLVHVAMVEAAGSGSLADIYLDLAHAPTRPPVPYDSITLPLGVGVQVVDDPFDAVTGVQNDRYLGYNTRHVDGATELLATRIPYGGVILFDSRGQIVSKSYAFRCRKAPTTLDPNPFTNMGMLLHQPTSDELNTPLAHQMDVVPIGSARSAVGLLLFDLQYFSGIEENTLDDPQVTSPGLYPPAEVAEEQWLDQNALPLLVNRYNGTLIKGE